MARRRLRRNILRDTWAYKEIKQEGFDEGFRKGWQEGFDEELRKARQEVLEEHRLAMVEIVRGRFPSLESLTRDTVAAVVELGALRHLIVKVSLASTEEVARQVLLTEGKTRD